MVTIFSSVYNTKNYISQCLDSVLAQTYTDFECIIFDNGCTDGTSEILDQYAAMDNRFILKRLKENKNIPHFLYLLDEMNGKYFTIIDSDDWWEPNYLERMIKFLEENNLDLAITGTRVYDDVKHRYGTLRQLIDQKVFTQKQFAKKYPEYWIFPSTYWGNIMKLDILRRVKFSMDEKLTYGADTIRVLQYVMNCDRIGIDNSALYYYRIRDSSSSYTYDKNRFFSNVYEIDCICDFLKSHCAWDFGMREWLKAVFLRTIHETIKVLSESDLPEDYKTSELLTILKHPYTKAGLALDHPSVIEFRQVAFSILQKNSDLNENVLNEIIYIIVPGCPYAINLSNLSILSDSSELAEAIYADDRDAVMVQLLYMIKNNELVKKYNLCAMVKALSNSDPLLLRACNNGFLRHYGHIYLEVWRKRYDDALNQMTVLIHKNKNVKEDFLELYLNLAALLQKEDEFIYGKLICVRYYLRSKNYDECRQNLNDLVEMGVEDNDEIIRIKRELEKVGK